MNVQLNSLENIIITEDVTEDEQIDNIIIPAEPFDEDDQDSDHFDEFENLSAKSSDISPQTRKTVRSIPYQVIAVNRIDDAEPIQSKTSFEFLSELPLFQSKKVIVPLEDKTQSINPSQDITSVIRSRYQALTKKHDVVQNNDEAHDKTIPKVPLIGTMPKVTSQFEMIRNTSTCIECKALQMRVERLESELSQSKLAVKHLEYKLSNSHRTVSSLKTRLRRREEKLTKLTGREFKKFSSNYRTGIMLQRNLN